MESNNFMSVNTDIESRDAIFDKERFTSIPRPRDMIHQSFSKNTTQAEDAFGGRCFVLELIKSTRARKAKSFGSNFQLYLVERTRDETVYGTIDKYKVRLVIQGVRQKEGIDSFDTYAPVASISIIRLLLALVAIHNLVIHQMIVKTAFLNNKLDKEIYMKQPEGFVIPGYKHKVYKLKKSYMNCSPVSTPIDPSLKLLPSKGSPSSHLEYSRAIGCLMYVMISIKRDIANSVGRLSRYTSK
uniref:Reverse transcriptase Ty1/copia-type domain-containing protein n=1 Tax=Lactuca sativa TaxID=4236 RepID=A0A9R1W599_LACSA|nr:hypothetical protein LSAT_V11C300106500 [Lactuca sativa]